jgi:DNA transposition AAA+ family ATPase
MIRSPSAPQQTTNGQAIAPDGEVAPEAPAAESHGEPDTPSDGPDVTYWRGELRDYIDETGRSIRAAARGMGRGASSVSQFLNSKYEGDDEKLARDVRSYLLREQERERREREGVLSTGGAASGEAARAPVETEAFQRLHHIARLCHVERDIGVAVAEAGSGKTVAAAAYAEEHPDALFIEAGPEFSAKPLAQEVARALSLDTRGTLYGVMRRVYERLEDSGRLLIVDEAESLPVRGLELVRRIHDKTGVGVLLVGLDELLEVLSASEREFKQLWSRVGLKAKLPGQLSEEDTRALVRATLPAASGSDAEAIAQAARAAGATGARTLAKLLRRAASVAEMNDLDGVTPAVIEKAKQLLIL